MAQINEAESIQREIENHCHFNKCLDYNTKTDFYNKKNSLTNALNNYNNLRNTEIDIINATHNKTSAEKELNILKSISEKD
jgi:hypothetical protein